MRERFMLRNRSDQFGKNVLRELLSLGGDARTEEEVPPGNAQRIDVWFIPDPTRREVLVRVLGIVAKIAENPAMIELWSEAFGVRGFHASMRKLYDWHHTLELRDKRLWCLPSTWHLCARRPDAVFAEFLWEPVPGGPVGLYRLVDQGFPVFVVVIPELPRVRETLLLRLLGRPADRLAAMAELEELEADAVEHQVADEWLIRLYSDLKQADPASLAEEEREFVMGAWLEERDRNLVKNAVETTRRETRRETQRKTRRETQRKTRREFVSHFIRMRIGRELTKRELSTLGKHLDQDKDDARIAVIVGQWPVSELLAWLASTDKQS